jgi:AmmeMemoRadiSam system protein B
MALFADARGGIACCRLVLGLVSYDVCQELGYAVAQTMSHSSRSVVIIASTDMTPLMPAGLYIA